MESRVSEADCEGESVSVSKGSESEADCVGERVCV